MVEEDPDPERSSSAAESQPSSSGPPEPRILFLVPFPPRRDARHGGRVVAQLLFRMARRYRVAVVYLVDDEGSLMEPDLVSACDLVVPVEPRRPPSRRRERFGVLVSPITGIPAQVGAVRDPEFTEAALSALRSWRPNVVQIEHDNLSYVGPAIREAAERSLGLVLVCHEPGALAAADQARVATGRHRVEHRLNLSAWRRFWARTLPVFDVIVAFTENDREVIARAAPGVRTETIGLGIDIPAEPAGEAGGGGDHVAFIGGYRHPPNTDAALRLVRSIMPTVREQVPGLGLNLVGADPAPEMFAAAGPDDVITGRVPDAVPYMAAAPLIVLPIRLGGGMRVKLLEALAAGKAVIATRLAAAGLDLSDGVQIVFAESDEEFADAIVELIGDPDARRRLGD
jgi:glycosyltransferase involved in cell wall biosynthesis